ncbi:hypothetical protein HID58_088010 [Brassica napus]|uniref:FBD domain-containing protein n=1 Tax=Brassica napus TaxID=3708 RepID=A0ABQ7XUX7_BRANA|nr:hypothetical protein HID58_088010 [Brassica napus]
MRISSLSDDLLLKILSSLRTKKCPFNLCFSPNDGSFFGPWFQNSILNMNLVVLKLYKSILVYVPDDLEVSLSSLKTLHLLCVEYENEESHRRLLRGCPVLEELVVDKTDNWSVRSSSVVIPSLERLSVLNQYRDYEAYTDKLEHESYNDRVTINVPSLKYLDYVDIVDYGHLCLSEDMPELVEAHVKLVCKNPEKLMRSLTAVKRLSLCLFNHSMVQHRIGFDQLVHLELCGCSPKWWDLLTWILKSSPKLQVLKLNQCQEECFCSVKPIERWWEELNTCPIKPIEGLPFLNVTFHLNTFEWNYYNGRREEKKLVAYILRTAKRLKIAEISAWDFDPEEESQILKEVASLHRASKSCKLLLGF